MIISLIDFIISCIIDIYIEIEYFYYSYIVKDYFKKLKYRRSCYK